VSITRSLTTQLGTSGLNWIVPEWPAPLNVHALSTTRHDGLDFALRGADAPRAREVLRALIPAEPHWLAQVHGTTIVDLDADAVVVPQADGAVTRCAGQVCAVLSADCLPLLLADNDGTTVGAMHAGWRGLAAGVIESGVMAMRVDPANLLAWLGPAIGPSAFEVGDEVRAAFCDRDAGAASAFVAGSPGKWLADLYALARRRLAAAGVARCFGGGRCTLSEGEIFYSYRRGGSERSRRMATLIWRT
jgi:YfiH family protein